MEVVEEAVDNRACPQRLEEAVVAPVADNMSFLNEVSKSVCYLRTHKSPRTKGGITHAYIPVGVLDIDRIDCRRCINV